MTMEELKRDVEFLRRDLTALQAKMPRGTTRRSSIDGHDHQELRGRRVADTTPSDGQIWQFSTTRKQWEPAAAGGGGGTAHVIQEDSVALAQRAGLNFRQGLKAVDDSGNNASRIDADFALASDLQADAATASAGTDTRLTRGGHAHPGAYTDAKARTAAKFVIYVPLGNTPLGQTKTDGL